jgi:hypothetical protein
MKSDSRHQKQERLLTVDMQNHYQFSSRLFPRNIRRTHFPYLQELI